MRAFRDTGSELPGNNTMAGRTVVLGQRHKTFPNWDTRGEVQDIPEDRITFWAWRIRPGGFLPLPSETEETDTKQQYVEHKDIKHDGGGGMQGRPRNSRS